MNQTEPVDWLNKACEGYVMNAAFSPENSAMITQLMQVIQQELSDAVFVMPERSLHITLLDWIAPPVDYGRNKSNLYREIHDSYDRAMKGILSDKSPIPVHFNEIRATSSTIILTGTYNGEFQRIRSSYLDSVELLPGTKLPPTIIHCSIARYTRSIDFALVEQVVSSLSIDFVQLVDRLRLVHTHREPMLEFEVVNEYILPSQHKALPRP